MIGLIIGVIRMVMDFSYPEPLCMEHDTRPSIVADVSYVYLFKFCLKKLNSRYSSF